MADQILWKKNNSKCEKFWKREKQSTMGGANIGRKQSSLGCEKGLGSDFKKMTFK